jgi:hypothetical protein
MDFPAVSRQAPDDPFVFQVELLDMAAVPGAFVLGAAYGAHITHEAHYRDRHRREPHKELHISPNNLTNQ